MTWSPISFGLGLDKDDNTQLFEKLSIKVEYVSILKG